MSERRLGYLYGMAANVMWGFFPLYFQLLRPAGPLEVLAHRVVWSLVFVTLILLALRAWRPLAGLVRRPRTMAGLALAAALIGINWGVYIYGVNTDRVLETALGYFVNPLVAVVLGVTVLGERLRRLQWAAVGVGVVAVVVLTVEYGRPPWIALVLAFSFALYGLTKKRLSVRPADGLFVESAVLVVPAAGYLLWLGRQGDAVVGQVSGGHTVLVLLSGVATAVPLMLFAAAANRAPLSHLGLLQYLTPTLQMICGVVILHEPLPPARLAGFALVWLALLVFSVDGLRAARRTPPAGSPEAAAVTAPPG
jgi:chloramphenicol-sensitive protein RarD